ncbi:SPOR domain-containing protein [Roseovarius sp. 2305UL8-3]|uniref:SPOR domain-containing protein n=1 Tax=Roseovarius conchicola TaxID=3121636 RepID=UPI003527156D
MRVSSYIAIAVIAASSGLGFSQVQAQSISSVQAPAEFPPSSFTGRQYVDSNGCVFVRAGIDGNVTWVPRVSRDRKVICGFQPSIARPTQVTEAPAQTAPAAAPASTAPAAKPAAKPKSTTATVARAPAAKPAAAPKPQVVRVPAPTQPTVATKPKTVKVVKAAPKKVAPKKVVKRTAVPPRQSACRGASAISSQYLKAASGVNVRCGPQATTHATLRKDGQGRVIRTTSVSNSPSYTQPVPLKRSATHASTYGTGTVTAVSTRIVPRRIYEERVASTRGVYIPKGYKAAWDDDRLNPRRAYQTYSGRAQMQLVWTNTVPRRLVDRRSGREVADMYPGLQYPHLSYAEQEQAQVTMSSRGKVQQAKRQVEAANPGAQRRALRKQEQAQQQARKPAQKTAVVSSRSTVRKAQPSAVSHRYVQAGMFADRGNAQRAAQRVANAGLPAKLGKATRNGRTYGVVVAGPFQSQAQLNSALKRVRAMGFGDAFLRK